MMKLIGKLQNGMTFTEEFDGVNDFLALQQSDYNAIADEIEVVEQALSAGQEGQVLTADSAGKYAV